MIDALALDEAASELRAAFPDPWIRSYSVKANDIAAIVARLTRDDGPGALGANVVSRGEWAIASRVGVPNERITLEGVGKTDADLLAAAQAAAQGRPLRWVAIESEDEAARLAEVATQHSAQVDVLLRFNPDVAPETHPGLAVGTGDSKFGLAEPELARAIDAGGGPNGPLRWRGLHVHVGSQLGAVDSWRDAIRRALALLTLMRGGLPEFDTLDVGGGFPVAPFGSSGPDGGPAAPAPARFAREMDALLDSIPADRRPGRLAVEPGRFLVARAGWLLGRVLHVRERGDRPLVVIDAGMTELIRPALYGASHPIVALTSIGRPVDRGGIGASIEIRETRVDGPICESTDQLGVHRLPPLRRGDLVAIHDAGAYASVLGSTYNGRPRPPQVVVEPDGRLTLARRRGTIASLG